MSRHSSGVRKREQDIPAADWEQYVRDNAVQLVRERDAKIERMRKRITLLEKQSAHRKQYIREIKGAS